MGKCSWCDVGIDEMNLVYDYQKSRISVVQNRCRFIGKDISLPTPSSKIQFNVSSVSPKKTYKVSIVAQNISGNGLCFCNFYGGPELDFKKHTLEIDSREEKKYVFYISTEGYKKRTPILFRIWREKDFSDGNIIIKDIKIFEMPSEIKISDSPTLSIIIPAYNELFVTMACLHSVCENTETSYEIIVIDNGSKEKISEEISKQFSGVKVIKNEQNLGFAKACNQGILQAKGKYVLLLNNDTKVLEASWESPMIKTLEEYADITGPVGGLLDVSTCRFIKEVNSGNQMFHYIAGWCMMFRKNIIDKIGMIPEEYGIGLFEDTTFCTKARKAGLRLAITEKVPVFHYQHVTIKKMGFKELYEKNREKFLEQYGGMLVDLEANVAQKLSYDLNNFNVKNKSKGLVPGKVSIITLNYNGIGILKKTIPTLINNTKYPFYEWIVSDNGSRDGSVVYLEKMAEKYPVIKFYNRNSNNGNFASINNELANMSDGEYLLFLNNDVEVGVNWLTEMMRIMVSDKDVSIVGSLLYYPQQKIQHAGIIFDYRGLPGNISYLNLSLFSDRKSFTKVDREFNAVTGACLLIRNEDFRKVGGFHEKYDYAYEDVDLCIAIKRRLGKKIIYCAGAPSIHYESFTTRKSKKKIDLDYNTRILNARWRDCLPKDMGEYRRNPNYGVYNKPRITVEELYKKIGINVVCCVDDVDIYKKFLKPSIGKFRVPYKIIKIDNTQGSYTSMSEALNKHMENLPFDITIIAHQDMELDAGFDIKLIEKISKLKDWGVLGLAGVKSNDTPVGRLKDFEGKVWNASSDEEGQIQIVDECCMVISRSNGLGFDHHTFTSFHFYGADLCMQSMSKGLRNYILNIPATHHSDEGKRSINKTSQEIYKREMLKLKNKWISQFPVIRTTTCRLTADKNIIFVKEEKQNVSTNN